MFARSIPEPAPSCLVLTKTRLDPVEPGRVTSVQRCQVSTCNNHVGSWDVARGVVQSPIRAISNNGRARRAERQATFGRNRVKTMHHEKQYPDWRIPNVLCRRIPDVYSDPIAEPNCRQVRPVLEISITVPSQRLA